MQPADDLAPSAVTGWDALEHAPPHGRPRTAGPQEGRSFKKRVKRSEPMLPRFVDVFTG
jgi:hypothetical protein